MKAPPAVFAGILSLSLAAPLAGEAQPALEQLRFDPPRLCLRDTFRWGFSYRGFPGGLAAVTDLELSGEGPGEPPIRSALTPRREDLQRYTTDQGRFESPLRHWSPSTKAPAGGVDIRYTLRVVLADGREVTSATSVRYVDTCPPLAPYTTLAAGPTGSDRLPDRDARGAGLPPGDQVPDHQPGLGGPRASPLDGPSVARPSFSRTVPAG